MNIPRTEYPRPQFERTEWTNLNGKWQFEFDMGRSGISRGLHNIEHQLSGEIIVPFCPQSKLSGIEYVDFIYGAWYKRQFHVDHTSEKRTVLHFGAVDYKATVYVNGERVGEHVGGYTSFEFDISAYVKDGENQLAVFVEDDERDSSIPSGKQSARYESYGCSYTRTIGIWQTVWLEFTPKEYIEWVKYYPDYKNGAVTIEAKLCGAGELGIEISYDGRTAASEKICGCDNVVRTTMELSEIQLWEVGCGRLYDVNLSFHADSVKSYFGLREIGIEGKKVTINGKSVFQRLVLDQGFYPDGIYTAPSDEALQKDIKLSMECGFNGARLHQKVFEERFLYHCDRLGYIVWGEYGDWGMDTKKPENIYSFLMQWIETIERDFNHPAIITWCPHNESDLNDYCPSILMPYVITKKLDNTRPCVDTSGWKHIKTDIFDLHDYSADGAQMKKNYAKFDLDGKMEPPLNIRYDGIVIPQEYHGEPVIISECGGARWTDEKSTSWGYGDDPKTEDEFVARFEALVDALISNGSIAGMCYTQLTDVEQEKNGLYYYDRTPKFNCDRFKKILQRKAKIEE